MRRHSERSPYANHPGWIEGQQNRDRVRAYLQAHLGATQRECAEALGLSPMAVSRHVQALRSEWRQGHE